MYNHNRQTDPISQITALIKRRTESIALSVDARRVLAQAVDGDLAFLARRPSIVTVIPTVQRGLGGSEEAILPFHAAWLLMYAAVGRLDHLQDGDPTEEQHELAGGQAAQYNSVLSTYLLATSLLDTLSMVPLGRVLRLRRFWANCMLLMAAGQQRDLAVPSIGLQDISLDDYQHITLMKTGATFALAFGGTALLLTDDQRVADVLSVAGELYGALLQYGDDALDAAAQPDGATLPNVLRNTFKTTPLTPQTPTQFWSYLYPIYHAAAVKALAGVQPVLRDAVLDLFRQTFETAELG